MTGPISQTENFLSSQVDYYELEALHRLIPSHKNDLKKLVFNLFRHVPLPNPCIGKQVSFKASLLAEIINDREKVQKLSLRYLQSGYHVLCEIISKMTLSEPNIRYCDNAICLETKADTCSDTKELLEIKFTSHLTLVHDDVQEYLRHLILIFYVSNPDYSDLCVSLLESTQIRFEFDGIDITERLKEFDTHLSIFILKRYGTNKLTYILRTIFTDRILIDYYIYSNFLTQISMDVQTLLHQAFYIYKVSPFRGKPGSANAVPLIANCPDHQYSMHRTSKKRPVEEFHVISLVNSEGHELENSLEDPSTIIEKWFT